MVRKCIFKHQLLGGLRSELLQKHTGVFDTAVWCLNKATFPIDLHFYTLVPLTPPSQRRASCGATVLLLLFLRLLSLELHFCLSLHVAFVLST